MSQTAVELLQRFKENYHYNNTMLAKRLGTSETQISLWLNGKSRPNTKSKNAIYNLMYEECIPAVIQLPPLKGKWNAYYFLAVADMYNPYGLYHDSIWHGEEPNVFEHWLMLWKRRVPNPEPYRIYFPGKAGNQVAFLDSLNLMAAQEHKDLIATCKSIDEIKQKYPGLRVSELDTQLVEQIMRGEFK